MDSISRALIETSEYGDAAAVLKLLEAGLKCGMDMGLAINSTLKDDIFRRTALHRAAAHGQYDVVDILLKVGCLTKLYSMTSYYYSHLS